MKKKISCFVILIFLVLSVSGCVTVHSLKNMSILTDKTIVVVPIKGPAISIGNVHNATVVMLGIGARIESALSESPVSICGQLNPALSTFVPERILAEEFVDVLRNSGQMNDRPVSLYNDIVIMKGSLPLIDSETRPFRPKLGFVKLMQWNGVLGQWWKSKPSENYSITETPLTQSVILEVVPYSIIWNHKDKVIEIILFVRLVDPISGVVFASNQGPGLIENDTVRPFKNIEDAGNFVEDFRKVARGMAEKCLKQLKIVN